MTREQAVALNPRDMRLRLPTSNLIVPGHLMLQIDPGEFASGKRCWIVQEATHIDGTKVFIPEGRNTVETITLLEGIVAALKDQANNPIPLAVIVTPPPA